MGTGLRQVVEDSKTHAQALNDVCHAVNTLKEVMGQKFAEAADECRGSFVRTADIRGSVIQEVQEMFNVQGCEISNISQHVNSIKQTLSKDVITAVTQNGVKVEDNAVKIGQVQTEMRESNEETTILLGNALRLMSFNNKIAPLINMTKMSARKRMLINQGRLDFYCDPVYLRGYYISPVVPLKKKGGSITLHIGIQLHRGVIDDVLVWPFSQSVKLSVIHPESRKMKEISYRPKGIDLKHFSKPAAPKERMKRVDSTFFLLSDLEGDGFVKDDTLVFQYELHE